MCPLLNYLATMGDSGITSVSACKLLTAATAAAFLCRCQCSTHETRAASFLCHSEDELHFLEVTDKDSRAISWSFVQLMICSVVWASNSDANSSVPLRVAQSVVNQPQPQDHGMQKAWLLYFASQP